MYKEELRKQANEQLKQQRQDWFAADDKAKKRFEYLKQPGRNLLVIETTKTAARSKFTAKAIPERSSATPVPPAAPTPAVEAESAV